MGTPRAVHQHRQGVGSQDIAQADHSLLGAGKRAALRQHGFTADDASIFTTRRACSRSLASREGVRRQVDEHRPRRGLSSQGRAPCRRRARLISASRRRQRGGRSRPPRWRARSLRRSAPAHPDPATQSALAAALTGTAVAALVRLAVTGCRHHVHDARAARAASGAS